MEAGEAGNCRVEAKLEKSNRRSKTKRATSFTDAIRHVWKRRSFAFKRKGKRGDMPSFGTQPLSGSDDAASQGRQDNDLEAPQASQSAVLFPFPDWRLWKLSAPTWRLCRNLVVAELPPRCTFSKGRRLPRNRTFCDLLPRTLQSLIMISRFGEGGSASNVWK